MEVKNANTRVDYEKLLSDLRCCGVAVDAAVTTIETMLADTASTIEPITEPAVTEPAVNVRTSPLVTKRRPELRGFTRDIYEYLSRMPERELHIDEVVRGMGVEGKRTSVANTLAHLVRKELIVSVGRGRYRAPAVQSDHQPADTAAQVEEQ